MEERRQEQTSTQASPEQVQYASVLEKGMYLGLGILLVTFALYAFGIMKPYIPRDEISSYWSLSVHDYLEAAEVHAGWAWVNRIGYGDFVNFVGVVILAGVTIACYLSIVPVLLRQRDRLYAVLALVEVVILGLAASGLLAVGH